MQDEISLREIIEVVWKGKAVIAIVTIAAMIVAAIISFFVLSPVYEAQSSVRVAKNAEILNALSETIISDATINRMINKLQLDKDQYTIKDLKDSITIEHESNTDIAHIIVKGSDSSFITDISNLLAFELGSRVEMTDRSNQIVEYQNQLIDLEDSIAVTQSELDETEEQLANTPEKLITYQSLADEPYLQSVIQENSDISSRELGEVSLVNETINPLYTSLKSKVAELTIQLSKLAEQKKTMEAAITRNEQEITLLDEQINDEKLRAQDTERLLNGFSAVFITPAIEPELPTGPNKILNVAIAMVLGAMISILYVFVRHYWIVSGTATYTGQTHSS